MASIGCAVIEVGINGAFALGGSAFVGNFFSCVVIVCCGSTGCVMRVIQKIQMMRNSFQLLCGRKMVLLVCCLGKGCS